MSFILLLLLTFCFNLTHAQIRTDGTLGTATTLNGPDFHIDAELGQQYGANLFHSFTDFNLNAGESATFTGSEAIHNVISRVTGGQTSQLNGTLRSTISNADIYFINPTGIVLGAEAELDITGSFYASTADTLNFVDGATFHARNPTQSTLTLAPPTAFGFLSSTPASLSVHNSKLNVVTGETLALSAGAIHLDNAELYAPSGQLALFTARNVDNVSLDGTTHSTSGDILLQNSVLSSNGTRGGTINLHGETVEIDNAQLISNTSGDEDGRPIHVQATNLAVLAGGQISTATTAAGRSGDVQLDIRERLQVSGENSDWLTSYVATQVVSEATGQGGTLQITAKQLDISEGGIVATVTMGEGDAGTMDLNITEQIDIHGASRTAIPSQINTDTHGSGNGGNLNLTTQRLNVINGGVITASTLSYGNGGNIDLHVAEQVLIKGENAYQQLSRVLSATAGEGTGGNITIEAQQLTLDAGGQLDVSTLGQGSGGHLVLNIAGAVTVRGEGSIRASRILGRTEGEQDSGTIRIHAQQVNIEAGGEIDSTSFGAGQGGDIILDIEEGVVIQGEMQDGTPSTLITSTSGIGNSGSIHIDAKQLDVLAGGEIDSSSFGAGQGGDIVLDIEESVVIQGEKQDGTPSRLITSTLSLGDSGSIHIDAKQLDVLAGGQINVSNLEDGEGGASGDIDLNITGRITVAGTTVQGDVSSIAAETVNEENAGSIRLNAGQLTLQAGARISATTTESAVGRGGNIDINVVDTIRLDGKGTQITAYSQAEPKEVEALTEGQAGSLRLQSRRLLLNNGAALNLSTAGAQGGDIVIHTYDYLYLNDGTINTHVPASLGSGGNISISPGFIVLDNGRINANAYQGNGGNITIDSYGTYQFDSTPLTEVITASSELGISGNIAITTPDINLSGALTLLTPDFIDADALLLAACENYGADEMSRFDTRLYLTIPPLPSGLLGGDIVVK